MLTCQQATRLYSESQERALSLHEKLQLQMHIALCRGCRNFGKQMPLLRSLSRRYASGNTPASPEE